MIIFVCLILFLIIFISAAYLKAQYLTRKRPVAFLLTQRKNSADYCAWEKISEEGKKYFILIEDPGFYERRGTTLKTLIRRGIAGFNRRNQIIHGQDRIPENHGIIHLPENRTLSHERRDIYLLFKYNLLWK